MRKSITLNVSVSGDGVVVSNPAGTINGKTVQSVDGNKSFNMLSKPGKSWICLFHIQEFYCN